MADNSYLPLLGFGAGLLNASQPGQARGFGGSLSAGLLGGLQGMQMAQQQEDDTRAGRLRELQMTLMVRQMQKAEAEAQQRQAAFAQATAGMDPQKAALLQAGGPEAFASYVQNQLAPPKAPEVRDFFEGDNIVQKQFNSQTGQWDVIGGGRRWQPQQAAGVDLVSVVGPDGKPILVPDTQAAGMTPYEASNASPDWTAVQDPSDPNKAVYLDKRTGRPVSGPDGQPLRPASQRDAGAGFTQAKDLRKAFEDLTADPRDVVTNYGKIEGGFKENSGAGDVAGIFGYMKMLDPTSVVREGEFATAENSAGVTESIRNMYNKLLNGDRLSAKAREEILSAARSQIGPYKKRYEDTANTYTGLANSFGVDPATVVTPLQFPDFSAPPSPMNPPPVAAAPAPPASQVVPPAAAAPAQQQDDWSTMFGFPSP